MKTRFLWLVPALLCLGATECRNEGDLGEETDVAFETLDYTTGSPVKGTASGVTSKQLVVVRDIDAFTGLWMDHAAGLSPQPTQPTVEFGTDMVIAAFMGSRSTGGYVITVEDVRENDEFIIVEIEMETPGSGCDVTDGVTQPHHMVVLPDSDKPVQFSETTVDSTC